jgi:integrase
MPVKRKSENRGFPARWCWRHGAIYYEVPRGLEYLWNGKKLFRLGKTPPEAYKEWAKRLEATDTANTIGQLLDRYALEVVPTKAPATRHSNARELVEIRNVFGHEPLGSMTPQKVYKYMDVRTAKSRGRKEIALLSHAYTKAVEWGLIARHPFKGEVRLECQKSRDRYVEDWEIAEVMSLEPERNTGSILAIKAYIRLKTITGMARGDLLRLQPGRDFKEDGIHIQRHKTAKKNGKRTIYEWTPELNAAKDAALAARPVDIGPWLFCNKLGKCYINEDTGEASGWDSMWGRFMDRLLAETKVTERFTEHDLRAKAGSDAESDEDARKMLSHANTEMTRKAYRRKPERVKPLK